MKERKEIIIRRPDDMHFHPRSGDMLRKVLPYTSKIFPRAVVMGNLPKPVVTVDDAEAYRKEILSIDPEFNPIMTIMLTKDTTAQVVREASKGGIKVVKFIPNNISTNSENGVCISNLIDFYPVLEMAERLGMIFSGHWESPLNKDGLSVSEIDREKDATRFLDAIANFFPGLKIVAEHASTKEMISYVEQAPANVAATLTVHHGLLTYDDVCDSSGKIYNPHHYCKPIAKTTSDRGAVIGAMLGGNPKFFFGSDSAPHLASAKKKIPAPAGIFTAPAALPLLCEIFEKNNILFKLEDFVSKFGAEFYGLTLNEGEIALIKDEWTVPEYVEEDVRIFWGGRKIGWRVERKSEVK